MKEDKANQLLNKKILLEKFPGKGGWTYARVPEIPPDRHAWFGWVRVNGSIDGVELKHYNLMPMGNNQLFLPVKAAIRKKIGKEAGDMVDIILYSDHSAIEVPENFLSCLKDEPDAFRKFELLPEQEKIRLIKWIEAPITDETRINRMAKVVNDLAAS